MKKKPVQKAIVAGLLVATIISIFIHFYYERQGIRALAVFVASGRVDAWTFQAFGYNGWITTMKYGPVSVNDDGSLTPVIFSQSYLSLMFVHWSKLAWLGFAIAFGITAFVALRIPRGKRIVPILGWLHIAVGTVIVAGAFVARKYLGLDGLMTTDSIQINNLIVGPVMALLGFWLTKGESPAVDNSD